MRYIVRGWSVAACLGLASACAARGGGEAGTSGGPTVGASAAPAAAPERAATASARLAELFADDWEFRLRESPEFATSVGDRRYSARLSEVSEAGEQRRADQRRAFLSRLASIDRSALSRQEQISYDIYQRLNEESLREFELRGHLIPITNREGFHTSFPQLPDRVPLRSVEDLENYIGRLNAFSDYTRQHIALMRAGLAEGRTLPRVVLAGFEGTLEPHIVSDPRTSLLWKPLDALPDSIAPAAQERLRAAATAAIRDSVAPAYANFLEFMTSEYIPGARQSLGASELPGGSELYSFLIRKYTTLEVTPEDVHRRGLSEVARIRGEMAAVMREAGFRGTHEEFLAFLRSDPRFYVDSPEELMRRTALVLKRMDGELPKLFGRLPRMSYGIKPIPDFIAPRTTTAYYSRPAGDGTRSGTYWVNLYDLKSRPLYEVEALSLHEAVPGHHLQIALQQEIEGIPDFRRFAGFTAFTEGWGLYAERLGLETGFYTDPYSNFGRLTYEMWRACRLVVDTGIHAKGWTRQQAIDFMAENTALTLLNIANEVDRYIAWPGQAVAYKTGELKIRELRQLAESELGPRFDVRQFHDVVLGSGAVPLTVLEENVRAYIATAQAER